MENSHGYPEARSRRQFYESADDQRYGSDRVDEITPLLRRLLADFNPEFVIELGCGLYGLKQLERQCIGLDISLYALTQTDQQRRICADWGFGLPIRSGSVPFAISIFVLEHIATIETALAELDRILAPGAVAYLKPAFNVPYWRANGLEYLNEDQLTVTQRVAKRTLIIRRLPVWRFLTDLLWRRIYDEYRLWRSTIVGRRISLRWTPLVPYKDAFVGPDSDSVCAVDKSALATWFIARGYRVLPGCGASTSIERLFSNHSALVVQKAL